MNRHPNIGETVYFIDYHNNETVKELGIVYDVFEFDGEIQVWINADVNSYNIVWFDSEKDFDEATQRWIRD